MAGVPTGREAALTAARAKRGMPWGAERPERRVPGEAYKKCSTVVLRLQVSLGSLHSTWACCCCGGGRGEAVVYCDHP